MTKFQMHLGGDADSEMEHAAVRLSGKTYSGDNYYELATSWWLDEGIYVNEFILTGQNSWECQTLHERPMKKIQKGS